MAITTLNASDSGVTSRTVINDNFTDLDTTKADLASPTFTGTPTLPTGTVAVTQTAGNNTTAVATTAFVTTAVSTGSTAGIASKNLADASTTQTIAHGLGRTPTIVRLTALFAAGAGMLNSYGLFNTSGNTVVMNCERSGTHYIATSATYSILLGDPAVASPLTNNQTGVVSVDATNITITWTKLASPTGTLSFLWEAQ